MGSLEACIGSGRFRERFGSAAYRAADLAGLSPRVLGGTFGIAVIEFIRNDASIPDGRRFRDRVRLLNLFGGWTWTHRQPIGRSFRLWQHRRFDSCMCGIEPWLLRVKTGFRGLVRVKCDPSQPAVNVLLARQKREGWCGGSQFPRGYDSVRGTQRGGNTASQPQLARFGLLVVGVAPSGRCPHACVWAPDASAAAVRGQKPRAAAARSSQGISEACGSVRQIRTGNRHAALVATSASQPGAFVVRARVV